MINKLLRLCGTALLPFLMVVAVRSAAWQTYQDTTAGFAFEYPADAHLSLEQEASQGYASVFVALPANGTGYQGYAVTVFANSDDLPLPRFLSERRGFTTFGGQTMRLNGIDAWRAAPDTALADGEAEAYWLRGDGVVVRIGLYAGSDESNGPSVAARTAFDRAVSSFRLIPRVAAVPITPAPAVAPLPNRPALTDEFISPYGVISTTTDYGEQWSIIITDTRYGVRNLSLLGSPRKCFGVTWPRMLHSALDLYRLDGQDAADTPVVAVTTGTVAYYNPAYTSYPGRVVILRHPLNDGREIYSMYAHLGSVLVTQGQVVTRGQPIGTVLYQPDDSHLHFEMRWFLDGSQIYPSYPSCNGVVYGRGYTYLTHPDDFPAPDHGYVDPDAFIQAHGGPPLTPIGLPDPRGPAITVQAASDDLNIVADHRAIEHGPLAAKPVPFDLGGPEAGAVSSTIKTAPTLLESTFITSSLTVFAAPDIPVLAPSLINTDTLTYTTYLPLITRSDPSQEPTCIEGQELLGNSGFEDGVGSAPWVQIQNGTSDLISTTQAFSGTYSLWLGGRDTADEEALQSFVVPSSTDALTLTFKRLLTTQEVEPKVYDHFELVLENQVGNEVTPQLVLTNLSSNRNVWVTEIIVFSGFNVWGDRRLRLSLKGMTDSNLGTSLFLDEVSLQRRCAP
jgi:murein DD-endopeptidase MepM/ murein hydrolase activator NlpD